MPAFVVSGAVGNHSCPSRDASQSNCRFETRTRVSIKRSEIKRLVPARYDPVTRDRSAVRCVGGHDGNEPLRIEAAVGAATIDNSLRRAELASLCVGESGSPRG